MAKKCSFDGYEFRPDGVNALDPCVYETIEVYRNATVIISKCKKCGHIDVSWIRQPNTESVDLEDWDDYDNY